MYRFILIGVLSICLFTKCVAQDSGKNIGKESIKKWADSIIGYSIEDYNIPGATFAFVEGDSIIYAQGYGYSNLATQSSMEPYTHNFDMGSIPKSMVAAAVLQLEEEKKLKLTDPISKYIDHQDAKSFRKITIHHLLTHSAGLDDISNINSASLNPEDVLTLKEYVANNQPVQIEEPGTIISYSNIGYALLGRVIEEVSGMNFSDYMQENILNPLEMKNSTFQSRLPAHIKESRATGYEFNGMELEAVPHNFQFNLPAGGLRSTAGDMANFLMFLLNDGSFKENQIVGKEELNKMFAKQFSNHPQLQGLTYSLREEFINGYRALGQNGGWQGFNHDFYLFKEANCAFIICLNGNDGSEISSILANSFVETFIRPKGTETHGQSPILHPEKYVGTYRSNRYSRNSITKLGVLLGVVPEFNITSRNDSLFYFSTPLIYEGKNVFRRYNKDGLLAFLENPDGEITHMVRDYSHYDANEKITWFQKSKNQMLFYVAILVLQIVVILIFAFGKIRFKQHRKSSFDWITQFAPSFLSIIFVAGFINAFFAVGAWNLQYGMSSEIKALLLVPLVLIGLLVLIGFLIFKKRNTVKQKIGKWNAILSFITLFLFLLFLDHWNLIGYNY
ncbi:beta-lactamase family protein [Muricauda sp. CAU 1633]|uniref:serine hydrolase domain-containing protein n=1 Tax=Allomuricauda sp. CAU 1633 TaxID=2816036 RepID=UPI001A902A9D|nr:serine hydrolase domain-containing protein [Muricauda sp. CAU 1633]MBO0322903.1 beta-lactamase family protein [Muricauda sp. CAU 1633]